MRVIRNENARWDFHSGGVKLSDKLGIAAFVLSFESVTSQFQFSEAEAVSTRGPLRSVFCFAACCTAVLTTSTE